MLRDDTRCWCAAVPRFCASARVIARSVIAPTLCHIIVVLQMNEVTEGMDEIPEKLVAAEKRFVDGYHRRSCEIGLGIILAPTTKRLLLSISSTHSLTHSLPRRFRQDRESHLIKAYTDRAAQVGARTCAHQMGAKFSCKHSSSPILSK